MASFKASGTSTINFDYFHVDNGAVIISPEYIDDLKRMYCIYIDTDARLNVYTKWKNFEKAKNEFDEAVKKAPKNIVDLDRSKLAEEKEKLKTLESQL